jgi:UDP-glucuronate decarboxylase
VDSGLLERGRVSKRILVTGGTGFLGTNLCLRLLAEDNHVIALDNFYTSAKENLDELQKHKNFEFVKADVIQPFPKMNADEVYNLACPASPPHYQKDPIYTMKISVLGALHALEFATERGAKILQASTSEVYGDPTEHPQTEAYRGSVNITGIRSCYDEGKRAAETLFMDYSRTKGAKIKIMRIFNTYGPHMDINDGRVVSNLIVQALKKEPLTIYGDGKQTRSFCYVDDLIDGMIRLMNSAEDIKGPVNIGNPDEFSVIDLAEKIQKKLDVKEPLTFRPMPSDDPKQRCPDIALAKKQLGWEPKIPLDSGLDQTIPWFKKALGL